MSDGKLEEKAGSGVVGYAHDDGSRDPVIGTEPTIRLDAIIYEDIATGDRFSIGHFAAIRERTEIGGDVLVGTNVAIDGGRRS